MAVTETMKSVTARPVLNSGTDGDGNVKTVNGSFGATLDVNAFNENSSEANTKLMNIASALEDVLSLTMFSVTKTTTVTLNS